LRNIHKTSPSVPDSYLRLSGSFFIDTSSSGRAGSHPVTEENEAEHIQDLLAIRDIIATHRHLCCDIGASRHEIDILEAYIYQYSKIVLLALFRMH